MQSADEILTELSLVKKTLTLVEEQRTEELLRKVTKRKRAAKFGPFTSADAERKLEEVALLSTFLSTLTN